MQECSGANGAPVCDLDVTAGSVWVSSIMRIGIPVPGSENYSVTWNPDPVIPANERAYSVVVMEVGNPQRRTRILPPVSVESLGKAN